MDKRIDQFLNEHKLIQYRENFLHFDFATFLNLNRNTISELIPSASDSTKLHNALISFINGSDDIDPICDGTNNDLPENDVFEIDVCSNGNVLPEFLELVPIEKRKSVNIEQLEHSSLNRTKMPRIEKAESINAVIKQEADDIEIIEMISDSDNNNEDDSSNDVQVLSDEEINFKAVANNSVLRKRKYILKKILKKLDLEEINDLDMTILFASYKINKGLNDRERTLLSEIIMKQILIQDTTLQLSKLEFRKVARLIVKTFPLESIGTYYKNIQYFNRSMVTTDRGSLYTAFKKYQDMLKTSGFPVAKDIVRRRKRRLVHTHETVAKLNKSTKNDESENETDSTNESENETGSTNLEPEKETCVTEVKSIEQLEKEFIASRNERLRKIEKEQSRGKFSTIKYVQLYKVLQTPKGYKLIMKDAEFLYPSLEGYVSNFGKIAHKLIQYAKGLHLTDEYVCNLLSYADNNISEDNEQLMAILLLPYILPRPPKLTSPLASAVQFIRLFSNEADETEIYEKLFEENSRFMTGLLYINLKLYGKFDNIYNIIVRVGVADYEFINPLHAVAVYFKMFLGMSLAYPIQAQHIFYFLGKVAFDVEKPRTMYYEFLLPILQMVNKN